MFRLTFILWTTLFAPSIIWAHGDIDRRIAAVTQALESAPNDTDFLWQRAELYRAHEEWDAALSDFERIRALTPGDVWLDLATAEVHFATRTLDRARVHVGRFTASVPDDYRGYELLARIERADGQFTAAADAYRTAQSLADHPPPAYFLNEANAREAATDPGGALEALDRGLARLGNLPALLLRAIEYARQHRLPERALAHADLLPASYASTPAGLTLRGEIHGELNQPLEAAAYYTDALDRLYSAHHPDDWSASEGALAARLAGYLSQSQATFEKGTE